MSESIQCDCILITIIIMAHNPPFGDSPGLSNKHYRPSLHSDFVHDSITVPLFDQVEVNNLKVSNLHDNLLSVNLKLSYVHVYVTGQFEVQLGRYLAIFFNHTGVK